MGWPFSTPFVVLRAFAKVIAVSRATNTVRDFTVGDFIPVIRLVSERADGGLDFACRKKIGRTIRRKSLQALRPLVVGGILTAVAVLLTPSYTGLSLPRTVLLGVRGPLRRLHGLALLDPCIHQRRWGAIGGSEC